MRSIFAISHFILFFSSFVFSNKSPSSLSPNDVGAMNGINSVLSNNIGLSAFTTMLPNMDDRSKKSQNMTECVPVPSSEHVAEIVGRQGKLIAIILFSLSYFALLLDNGQFVDFARVFFLSSTFDCKFEKYFALLLLKTLNKTRTHAKEPSMIIHQF